VEGLFAELKNRIGLRRLRLRRLRFVREQFFLAAIAQNLKRLARFLSRPKNRFYWPPLNRMQTKQTVTHMLICAHRKLKHRRTESNI
jgi:hypothetical protein